MSKNDKNDDDLKWPYTGPPEGRHYVYATPTSDDDEETFEDNYYVYPSLPESAFVISGPLKQGSWPGRRFESLDDAEDWVLSYYGGHYGAVKEITEVLRDRWAFFVSPREAQERSICRG
jgi:hypothetical protein